MLKGEVIRNIYYPQCYSLYKGLNIYPLDGTNSCLNCNDNNAFIYKSEALYVFVLCQLQKEPLRKVAVAAAALHCFS